MRKPKPITAETLFDEAFRRAKEAGDLIEILPILESYGTLSKDIPLTDYHFDMICAVCAGTNEGTRINISLQGNWSHEQQQFSTKYFAYLKTLNCDPDAFAILGRVAGMLTYYAGQYVGENLNRFSLKEATPHE